MGGSVSPMQTGVAKYKPYSAYKPSSVPWLGEVPSHCEVKWLKGHVTDVIDRSKPPRHDDIFLAIAHVESWTGRFIAAAMGLDSIAR